MIAIFFYLVILILILVRLLCWLAIFQQKEYRFDRLHLFLKSKDGLKNLLEIIPNPQKLNRKGLKRPVRTIRIYFLGSLAFLITLLMGILIIIFFAPLNLIKFFLIWLLVIFFIPVIIFLVNLPIQLLKMIFVRIELIRAKQKLARTRPIIIGITGSYSKTTTKFLISSVLSQKYKVFITPKSFNTIYGVAKSINKNLIDQDILILEYGAYTKNEIKKMTKWFKPEIAVITGLTPQHLGLFGSLENIIKAKSELVSALKNKNLVFANGKDEGTLKICQQGGAKTIRDYSGKNSSVIIDNFEIDEFGRLQFVWNQKVVKTNLVGSHYLDAIKASIAVGQFFDLNQSEIITGINDFNPKTNFIKSYIFKTNKLVIDDGQTSNPRGFSSAIDLTSQILSKHYSATAILVTAGIVDLGSKEKTIHYDLAIKSRKIFEKVFYLGENGKEEFRKVFKSDLIEDYEQIVKFLKTTDVDKSKIKQVTLIEGKIPIHLSQILEK